MDSIIKAIMSKVGVTQEQAQQAFDVTVGELKAQLPKDAVKHIDKLLGIKSLSLFEQVTNRMVHLKETLTEAIEEASTKGESKFDDLRTKYTELKNEAEQRLDELKSTAKSKVEAAKEKVEHAVEKEDDADNLNESELAAETAPVISTEDVETPKVETQEKKTAHSTGILTEAKERIEEVKEKIEDAKEKIAVIQDLGKEKLEEVKEFLDENKDKWAKTLKENAKNWLDKIIPDAEEKPSEEKVAEVAPETVTEVIVVEEVKAEEAK